jgi:SnoaL-like domain
MPGDDRDPLHLDRETIDHVAITRLLAAYADVVTRRAWPELADLFLAHASVRVDTVTAPARELTGPEELGAFISGAIERFAFFELVILNARVELPADDGPDRARARVLVNEVRQDRDGGAWSSTYGVYLDRYRRTADGWRFARRAYQSLARTGSERPFPFPADP